MIRWAIATKENKWREYYPLFDNVETAERYMKRRNILDDADYKIVKVRLTVIRGNQK